MKYIIFTLSILHFLCSCQQEYDDIVPPQQGQDAFENLGTPETDKSILILQASGHNPMLNEPELMNQTVIDFLSKYGK